MRSLFPPSVALATAILMAAVVPGGAQAQSSGMTDAELEAELAALRGRIGRLEADAATRPDLSFGLGDGTTVTVYGYVRGEAFYDFDFDQGDISNTAGLNTATPTDGAFNTSVRVSRLGFRLESQTDIGTIGGQLEYDLFGSGGTAELRLRHANFTINGWLVGQTWTNFMPIGQYPTSADFNGPVGIPFTRQPQVRYTGTAGDLTYSFSIEEAAWTSEDPVVTAAVQYDSDMFTGRLAAISGTVQEGGFEDDAYGINLAAIARPWQGGHIGATYTTGEGIGGIMIGGGNALTAAGVANELDGYTFEIRQDIGEQFNVGFVYGMEDYDDPGASDLSELETLHVNGFWRPTDNLSIGLEYIMGTRTDGAGAEIDAERIGVSATFSF